MKIQVLDLGKQPIANGFLKREEIPNEQFYNLIVDFDEDTSLLSIREQPNISTLFNDTYMYRSSGSQTMQKHFMEVASKMSGRVLEIGSNDGPVVRHMNPKTTVCVEPCKNMADITNNMGYYTYTEFWDTKLADKILQTFEPFNFIYAANCMCHIKDIDEAFKAVYKALDTSGTFIFEDPCLESMLEKTSYDQIYDEHAYIFSTKALIKLLEKQGLYIHRVESLSTHGGSKRYYVKKTPGPLIEYESIDGHTMLEFKERVEYSRHKLQNILMNLQKQGKKVMAIGATSKSTTIYNYCGIGPHLIQYITDITPEKQGLLSPGTHIPIIAPEQGLDESVDVAFLGAWNFAEEIKSKVKHLTDKNLKLFTHVPFPRFL